LKRNWAKIKEKGLNRKGFDSAGGYICKYRKTQGLFCKNTRAGGGLTGLTQLIRSRSIRSRSDGYGGLRVARAAELDLARRILIQWPGTLASGGAVGSVGQRRRPAVGGGGARRRSRTRAPGHDLKHREHLRVAREAAKLLEAARAATTRRSDRTTRRRGTGTPARSLGRHGARARQQVVQDDS
jgi:hypothetical protein